MKKNILTVFLLVALAFHASAQYPCPYVNAGPDQALPCGANCTTLSATYLASGSTGTYTLDSIAYTPFPYTSGVAPPIPFYTTDDEYSDSIRLPFTFCFFGTGYNWIVIGNNGMISFDTHLYAGQYNPWQLTTASNIPSSNQQLNSIMGPYMDIIPGELPIADSNYVNYATFGTAPCRKFVISYYKVPFYNTGICPNDNLTSQIVLYETTNVIEVYIGSKTSCAAWNGGLAIEGIQNAAGTVAYPVTGRNRTAWTATNDGRRWTPAGASDVAIAWYSNGILLGNTDTVSVCPPNNHSTAYVATATYQTCDTPYTVVSDTVFVNVLQSAGPVQYLSCPSPTASVTMAATGTGTWTLVPGNPAVTTFSNPTSPTTTVTGFSAVGTYYFAWSAGLCTDTTSVIVTQNANAGPDQNRCKNDTVQMAAFGTGTWSAVPTNPSSTNIFNPTLNSTKITGFTAGGAYAFVWTTNAGCTDTVIIHIPFFSLATSAGNTTVCQYSNTTITVTPSVANLGPFQYTWLDSGLVQSPHAATTLINGASGSTWYHVVVTSNDGCQLEDSILITTSALIGTVIKANANPTVVCAGNPTVLTVVANPNSCGLATSACTAPGTTVNAGTATTYQTGTAFQYPSPYGNYYASAHHQFLIHASELIGQVPSGGQIKSLSFQIHTTNSPSAVSNFTIKLACVSNDSLDGSFIALGSLTQVYTTASYLPVTGWNTHTFTTPYDWDGVSNIVVDVCFTNAGGGSINPKMDYTTTPFQSVWCTYGNDPGGLCNIIGTQYHVQVPYAQLFQRPNIQMNMCITDLTGANLLWTPGTGPNAPTPTNLDTVTAHPIATTQYEVQLTSPNGCVNYDFVTVNVDTSSRLSFNNDTFVCSVQPIQLNAVVTGSAVNPANVTYTWTGSNGIPITGGTGPSHASVTVTPTATTTYTVSISGTGCALFDSMHVTVGSGLPITAIVDSVKCTGNNNGSVSVFMTSGVPPYTYTWSPPAGNVSSITNLAPGTYYLTVADAGGCVGKDTFTLLPPVPLTLAFDSSNILCYNNNIDTIKALAGGGRAPYRYTWSPAQGNTGTLLNVAPGAYNLTVTDTSGCTISGVVHITQPTQLVSGDISTNLSGANTNDGTITVTTSGGVGPYTYSSVPATTGLPHATNLDTGLYIITVKDANGCIVYDTAHITGPPPIAIYFTVVNNPCAGDSQGAAAATAAGGVPPYTYQWSTVPGGAILGTANNISQLPAGTYQIVVTDANGLSVSKDTFITSPPAISIVIDSVPITCYNAANGQLKAIPSGGTGTFNIVWSTGNSNPLTNLGPGRYIVDVTDANGCPAADTAYLGQPAQLTLDTISTDSAVCFGQLNGFANVIAAGGKRPYTYVWSGSASVDSFANDLAAGPQTVTVKDSSGCTASVSFTIYQPSQIAINAVDTTSSHCTISADGVAVANVSGGEPGYTYSWDGTSTGSVDSVTRLATGTHTLSVTDSKGCNTSASFFINIQYTLTIGLTADSVSCNGGNNGIAFVSQKNGSPAYTYQWSPSSSTSDSATGLSAGAQSVTVTDMYLCTATGSTTIGQPNGILDVTYSANPLCTGQANGKAWVSAGGTSAPYTYMFSGSGTAHLITDTITGLAAGTYGLTITDAKGCTKTDSVTLTDPPALQPLSPAVTGISCANDANGIISLAPAGGTPPYTYAWSSGGYTAATEDSLAPGTYSIVVSDANGCTVSASVMLNAPAAISDSIFTDSTSCPGSADGHLLINANGGTPGNPITYTYSIDGIHYQQENNFYSLLAGDYQVYVMDSPGCVLQSTASIYQPSPITLLINPQDSLIDLGASIQLFSIIGNITTQAINSYAWSPAVGLSCLDCPNPFASPYQNTEYYLTINYGKNCIVTDSNLIEVGKTAHVYIPNAFTPNGDGVDDVFEVFGTTLQSVGMTVFNRWGEKVFDSGTSQWATWDGTYKGVLQPPGLYVYYVQLVFLDGSSSSKQGSLTLIR